MRFFCHEAAQERHGRRRVPQCADDPKSYKGAMNCISDTFCPTCAARGTQEYALRTS